MAADHTRGSVGVALAGAQARVVRALLTFGANPNVRAYHTGAATSDAFMVLWSDGTDVYLSSMYLAVDSGADFLFADLVGTNVAKLVGNTSITAGEFVAGNFAFIA